MSIYNQNHRTEFELDTNEIATRDVKCNLLQS